MKAGLEVASLYLYLNVLRSKEKKNEVKIKYKIFIMS